MEKQLFNSGWTYHKVGEETKTAITLPHDAMIHEGRALESKGAHNISYFLGYDYEYEKEFTLPESYKGKRIFIEFGGVYSYPEIYINGKEAGRRDYGYTDFYLDITPFVNFDGINTIKVIAHNGDQPNSRWYSGTGIYRDVYLYAYDEMSVLPNGIRITTESISPVKVNAEIKTSMDGEVSVSVLDADKKVVFEGKTETKDKVATLDLDIKEAKLWDLEHPYLYEAVIRFGEDEQHETFGIRTVSVGDKGFLLNDKRVIIKGSCIHHDNGVIGAVAHPFAEDRKIRLLKEAGYNAIRCAHNPCSKALLESCDRRGMLVLDEYVDCWYIHKTKYDYASKAMQNYKQDLLEMVEKDYNHPSVIMYSTGNEVAETSEKKGIEFTKAMTDYLHRLDQTRPVTCGINIFFNFLYSMGFGVYSDKKSDKEAEKKPTKKKKTVGSEFFNHITTLMGADFMKTGASLHGSDRKTRDAFANMDVAGYNYGIKRYKHDLKHYPNRIILGSETFCSDAYKFYEQAKKNPRLIGDFVWAGMDYLGEVGIGSWTDESYCKGDFSHSVGWATAGSGRLDLTGKELCEMAYTRVALEEGGIAIGTVPPKHFLMKCSDSAWKMSKCEASWNYPGDDGMKTKVEVYSRSPIVAIEVNGKEVGRKKNQKDCIVVFKNVVYHDGQIKAIGYDKSGKVLEETSLVTGKGKTSLVLNSENATISEDGLVYIRVRLADEEGLTRQEERGLVKVTKIENGTLLGLGSGCPFYDLSYADTDTLDTYFGEALLVVKPNGLGMVRLEASSDFGTAECQVEVR